MPSSTPPTTIIGSVIAGRVILPGIAVIRLAGVCNQPAVMPIDRAATLASRNVINAGLRVMMDQASTIN